MNIAFSEFYTFAYKGVFLTIMFLTICLDVWEKLRLFAKGTVWGLGLDLLYQTLDVELRIIV
jgi:hypothetical protein